MSKMREVYEAVGYADAIQEDPDQAFGWMAVELAFHRKTFNLCDPDCNSDDCLDEGLCGTCGIGVMCIACFWDEYRQVQDEERHWENEARRARKRVADLEQALERILMLVEGHDGSAADDALATVARFATRALYGVDRED